MEIFRHRTKTNQILSEKELFHGRVVFVEGPNGREERIFTKNGLFTHEEWKRWKCERASRNRSIHGERNRKQASRSHLVDKAFLSSR